MRSSNAAAVLRTLVPQARAIFKLLAEHQMENREEGEEEGSTSSLSMYPLPFMSFACRHDSPYQVKPKKRRKRLAISAILDLVATIFITYVCHRDDLCTAVPDEQRAPAGCQ